MEKSLFYSDLEGFKQTKVQNLSSLLFWERNGPTSEERGMHHPHRNDHEQKTAFRRLFLLDYEYEKIRKNPLRFYFSELWLLL